MAAMLDMSVHWHLDQSDGLDAHFLLSILAREGTDLAVRVAPGCCRSVHKSKFTLDFVT